MAVQTTPLAAGSLQGCCCPTAAPITYVSSLAIKVGRGLSDGMPLADGGADDAFGGPGHQVWRQDPSGNAAG